MTSKLRTFTKRVLIFINYGVVFFFLLACLDPYLDPQSWWFISFLGIGFPFLLLAVTGFMIWWLICKKKTCIDLCNRIIAGL